MATNTAGKWGCGCLSAILIYYVGIPLVMGLIKITYDEFKELTADMEIRAEKRREEERVKEVERQRAEEQVRMEAEQKRLAAERKAAEDARAKAGVERENRLRSFALKEAPSLWESLQTLEAQIINQDKKIDELRKALVAFNKNPDLDSDFRSICSLRDDMTGVKRSLRRKIEDAYIAYCKFQATPSRKDYDELRRKTLEDGIQEAEAAARRFTTMRKEK